jgi:hypothetical protein
MGVLEVAFKNSSLSSEVANQDFMLFTSSPSSPGTYLIFTENDWQLARRPDARIWMALFSQLSQCDISVTELIPHLQDLQCTERGSVIDGYVLEIPDPTTLQEFCPARGLETRFQFM